MSEEKYVDYVQVGVRIANRRRKMGLKQSEVNEKIDLSYQYLSQLESGRAVPSIDSLMKICAVLNTTPDYLLLGAVRSDSDDELIREKVKMITEKDKIELLSSFIDWLGERKV